MLVLKNKIMQIKSKKRVKDHGEYSPKNEK